MHDFTPYAALTGGAAIGMAAVLYRLLTGRYVGISGMLRSVIFAGDPDRWLDVMFVAGLVLGGVLAMIAQAHVPMMPSKTSLAAVAVGGIFVGYGTALGRGCTSGHGVCGLARLSPRSLAAVITFLISGFLTVYFIRHVF